MVNASPNKRVPISQLAKEVLPHIPSLDLRAIEPYVSRAAHEFADRTGVLKDVISLDAQAGVPDYQLDALHCDDCVIAISKVCVNGKRHVPLRCDPCCPTVCGAYFYEAPLIYLYAPPNCDAKDYVEVEAVVGPRRDACTIDRFLYEKYADGVVYKAVSELQLLPDASWYNPQQAGIMLSKYESWVRRATIDRAKQFSREPMYMQGECFI